MDHGHLAAAREAGDEPLRGGTDEPLVVGARELAGPGVEDLDDVQHVYTNLDPESLQVEA